MRAGAETGEAVRCSLVRLPRKAFANCYCFGREASLVCSYVLPPFSGPLRGLHRVIPVARRILAKIKRWALSPPFCNAVNALLPSSL